jgi:hypothetical protein
MTLSGLDLAKAYAGAWNERDETRRAELLQTCCEEDIRFLQDGIDEVKGIDALNSLIGQFWERVPAGAEVRVDITSDIQEHHGYGCGSFVWRHPDTPDWPGTDFVERGPNGKMKTIVVFAEPTPSS